MPATAPVMTLTTVAEQLNEVLKQPKYQPILGPVPTLQRVALATAYKTKPELTYAAAVNHALKKVRTLQELIVAAGSVDALLALDKQVNELRADLRRLVTISDAEQPFVPFPFLDGYKLYVDVNSAIKNLRTVVLPAFSQDIAQKKAAACADVIGRINTTVDTKAYAARLDALNTRLGKVLVQEPKPSFWDFLIPSFMKTKQKIKDQRARDAINTDLTDLLRALKQHDKPSAAQTNPGVEEVESVNNATLKLVNVFKQLASSDFATVNHTTVTADLMVLFTSRITVASVKKEEVLDAIRGLVKAYQDLPASAPAAQRETIHYVLSLTVSDSGLYIAETDRGFREEITQAITSIRAAFEGEQAAEARSTLQGLTQLSAPWVRALNVFIDATHEPVAVVSSPAKAQKSLTELEANVDTHLTAYISELTKVLPGLTELTFQETGSSRNATAIKSEVSRLVKGAFDAYQEHYLDLTSAQRTTLSTFLESDVALSVLNLTKSEMQKRNLDLAFLDKLDGVISNLTANKMGQTDSTVKDQIGAILDETLERVSSIRGSESKPLINLTEELFKNLSDFYAGRASELYAKASKNEVKPNVFILDCCETLLTAFSRSYDACGVVLRSVEETRSTYKELAETRLLALQTVLQSISDAALNSGKTPDFGAIREVFMNLPVLLASQNDDFEDIQQRTLAVITAFVDAYEANDVRFQGYDNVLSTLASVLSNYTYHLASFKPVLERMNVLLEKKQALSDNWIVVDIKVREIIDRLKPQLTDAKAISGIRKLSANFANELIAALGRYVSIASPDRRAGVIAHLDERLGKGKPVEFSALITKLSADKRALHDFGSVANNKENQSTSALNNASSSLVETLSEAASQFAVTVGQRVAHQDFNQVSDAHAFLATQTACLAPAEYAAVDAALRTEMSLLSAAIIGFAKQMPNLVRAADLPQDSITNVSEASTFLREILDKLVVEYNACCDSLVKLDSLKPAPVKAVAPVPAATATQAAAPVASFIPSFFFRAS